MTGSLLFFPGFEFSVESVAIVLISFIRTPKK
jgi:hypothetical protein